MYTKSSAVAEGHATQYVSWNPVICYIYSSTKHHTLLWHGEWPWRSLKELPLFDRPYITSWSVVGCNNDCILHRFRCKMHIYSLRDCVWPWHVLRFLNPVISLPSYAFSTCSKSLNASNTSSSHLPTKFSLLPILHNFITSSLFKVLVVLALHLSLLVTCPPSSSCLKITDRSFFRYTSPCFWNQLPLSLRQPHSGTSCSISDSPIPSPIPSFFLFWFTTLRIHNFFSLSLRLKTCLFHKSYPGYSL